MDDDFLEELDRRVSNVNLDKYWERKVGDLILWLSPIDYTQQIRVQEALREENPNAIDETKRVTLAGAIVGIGSVDKPVIDLRPHRSAGKAMKVRGKDGKTELLDLSEYLYRKIAGWDAELVVLVFDVYADVMASHRQEMVKDVKFENAKDPRQELEELEARVTEMRQGLGMPPLVEAKRLDAEPEPGPAVSDEPSPVPEKPEQPAAPESVSAEDFDPFEVVAPRRQVSPVAASPAPPQVAPPPSPEPERSFPVPVPPESAPVSPIQAELSRRSSRPSVVSFVGPDGPAPAHVAQPSVTPDVLDSPSPRIKVPAPAIDRGAESQSRNPRFSRPR